MRRIALLLPVLLVLALPSLAEASPSKIEPNPFMKKKLREQADQIKVDDKLWGSVRLRGRRLFYGCKYEGRCAEYAAYMKGKRTGSTITFTWDGFWGVMKCGSAIGAWITLNAVAAPAVISKIKRAGGIYKAATKIYKAEGKAKAAAAATFFAELAGVEKIIEDCG